MFWVFVYSKFNMEFMLYFPLASWDGGSHPCCFEIEEIFIYIYTMGPPKTYLFRGVYGKQPDFLGGHGFGGLW